MTSDKIIKTILAMIVLFIAIFVYFSYNPEHHIFFPPCPFHYITGLDCPGCGSQRATHSLLHLEFGKAFGYNPLLILAIPYLLVGGYMEYLGGKQKHPNFRKNVYGKNATIVIVVIVVTYWIVRNLV